MSTLLFFSTLGVYALVVWTACVTVVTPRVPVRLLTVTALAWTVVNFLYFLTT